MAKDVVLTQTERSEMIRKYASELNSLNRERVAVADKMRSLSRNVRNKLGMGTSDFGLAIKMYGAALRNKEKTIATIKEVMAALGDGEVTLTIAPPVPPPAAKKLPFGEATLGAKVLKFAADKGQFLTSEVRHEYGSSGATYLTILKNQGYVQKLGDGNWKFIAQG